MTSKLLYTTLPDRLIIAAMRIMDQLDHHHQWLCTIDAAAGLLAKRRRQLYTTLTDLQDAGLLQYHTAGGMVSITWTAGQYLPDQPIPVQLTAPASAEIRTSHDDDHQAPVQLNAPASAEIRTTVRKIAPVRKSAQQEMAPVKWLNTTTAAQTPKKHKNVAAVNTQTQTPPDTRSRAQVRSAKRALKSARIGGRGIGASMIDQLVTLPHVTGWYVAAHVQHANDRQDDLPLVIHRMRDGDPQPTSCRCYPGQHCDICHDPGVPLPIAPPDNIKPVDKTPDPVDKLLDKLPDTAHVTITGTTYTPHTLWQVTQQLLRDQMPRSNHDKIDHTHAVAWSADDHTLTVAAADDYTAQWLDARLTQTARHAISGMLGQPACVRFGAPQAR